MTTTAPMAAHVCMSWCRAPELPAATVTPGELDAHHRPYVKFECGMSLDVWSYGAVVYEILAGKPLARASDGAGVVANLLAALGPCPDDCPYSKLPDWLALVAVAEDVVSRRQLIPAEWNVPVACLKWVPGDRPTMAQVLHMDWRHHACVDAASPRAVSQTTPMAAVCQTLASSASSSVKF